MSDVASTVEAKIAGKKVMVFSKTYCPFCKKAKAVLEKYLKDGTLSSDDYEVMEIENDPNMDKIQDYMKKKTGGRSVPRVFINGKCIGGGDETAALDSKGQLVPMLKA